MTEVSTRGWLVISLFAFALLSAAVLVQRELDATAHLRNMEAAIEQNRHRVHALEADVARRQDRLAADGAGAVEVESLHQELRRLEVDMLGAATQLEALAEEALEIARSFEERVAEVRENPPDSVFPVFRLADGSTLESARIRRVTEEGVSFMTEYGVRLVRSDLLPQPYLRFYRLGPHHARFDVEAETLLLENAREVMGGVLGGLGSEDGPHACIAWFAASEEDASVLLAEHAGDLVSVLEERIEAEGERMVDLENFPLSITMLAQRRLHRWEESVRRLRAFALPQQQ